jgi:hypothetical protein
MCQITQRQVPEDQNVRIILRGFFFFLKVELSTAEWTASLVVMQQLGSHRTYFHEILYLGIFFGKYV